MAAVPSLREWDVADRTSFVPFVETDLGAVLLSRAASARLGDATHLVLSPRRAVEERRVTFSELGRETLRLAEALRRCGVGRRSRVILSFASDWSFIRTFYACQLLAAIPVPVVPPLNRAQVRARVEQLRSIVAECGASHLVTEGPLLAVMEGGLGRLAHVVDYEALASESAEATPDLPTGSDVAFIQYTSGSTGGRKGVPVTHAHLAANINAIGRVLSVAPRDSAVSFLPVYHDMGLIGKVILTLCHGNRLCQIPPLAFLRDPGHWLQSIAREGASVSAAPPFAYELCARRVTDEDLAPLDLSAWRAALVGADMIRREALDAFAARLAPKGFRREAFLPVYGLAESTLMTTAPPLGEALRARTFAMREAPAVELVCVGKPIEGHELRVVSPTGRDAAPGEEGEIFIRGPSVIDGYWGEPPRAGRDAWRATGDLGIWAEGGLYVSGRTKDIVKYHGRSLHPSVIEWTADEIEGVRRGCSAAFNAPGTDRVVLVVESKVRDHGAKRALADAVRVRVREVVGIDLKDVSVVPPHAVPKTTSGKVRRSATCDLYERSELRPSRRAQARDLVALAAHVVRGELSRKLTSVRRVGRTMLSGSNRAEKTP